MQMKQLERGASGECLEIPMPPRRKVVRNDARVGMMIRRTLDDIVTMSVDFDGGWPQNRTAAGQTAVVFCGS